jgi:hypothetical protein
VFKILEYSHLGGAEILQVRFPQINKEIDAVIASITNVKKLKKSKEKTKKGKMLYSPEDLNERFTKALNARGYNQLVDRYTVKIPNHDYEIKGAYKQVDFAKNRVLVEVQFGKYPFMFYDLFKFQYFFNEAKAEVGVEIVPAHYMHKQMSSGTSYGEQLLWDIERLKRHFPSVPVKVILISVEPLPTEHLVAEEGLRRSIAQQKEDI